MNIPPGTYQIITGRRLSADKAAEGVFPDGASVVLVKTEEFGRTVRYTYLVDYIDTEAA